MQLPVLPSPRPPEAAPAREPVQRETIERELAGAVRGQVRFGRHDRQLYSTDASIYQEEPIGVVVPADRDDVVRAVRVCDALGVPMLARGGGTSLAGQCTSRAVVLDASSRLLGIGPVQQGPAGPCVWAEAGVAPDELNHELARRMTGLFFAPDPATTAQATIGGCLGNNAAGSRSIKYGRTVDSVIEIDAVTSSGHRLTLGAGAGARDAVALKLADGVIGVVRRHERLIRERFPKTLRRNAGYALDLVLAQLDAGADAHTIDLTRLLVGSEGTLAVTLAARVRLLDLPRAKGLALVSFASVDEAIEAVPAILTCGVSATELVDDVVIEASLNNRECHAYVEAFPRLPGSPRLEDLRAVLYVEFHEGSAEAVAEKFARLRAVLGGRRVAVREVTDAPGMAQAWKLRKAGEPLLHGLPGRRKPLTFVEDNAVPPERLGEFVRGFRAIVEREGTRAAFWAHASVGVLHVRPMLDPHDPADQAALKRIAIEVADLAKACGGVMSGEHGDGKVRGPLLERYFGPELMGAFRDVKALFDPKGLFNPGNIVQPGPVDSILQRTRSEPLPGAHARVAQVSTFYRYDDHEGFAHAVERCNGAGVCRKQSGGTMCPSYRATMDERHSTRGRGNALRLAITGQAGTTGDGPAWSDPETVQTLDLCLSCKACKSECPSNVDISRLKAEYSAQRYRASGSVPISKLLTGYVRVLNRLGSVAPCISNAVAGSRAARALINRVMRMHPRRSLPRFARSLYSLWPGAEPAPAGAPRVALFGDCFTVYNESHVGLAARRVLVRAGYDVLLPGSNWQRADGAPAAGCCGRSMISVGMLPQAIATIDATLASLRPLIDDDHVKAVLFVEPSCLSAVKDDWLELKCATPLDVRRRLAAKSFLVEEFLERAWDAHPAREALAQAAQRARTGPAVMLHAHCHQKALWGAGTSAGLLKRFVGERLQVPDTGCCGMAGSFGYDADKFELSGRIARLPSGGVLPAVQRAGPGALICATGTSCRHQLHDAQVHATHPIELIDQLFNQIESEQAKERT
jgi:FAD/FMN-containing dehydrogenase/Fe-S oxidoreductase